MPETDEHTQRDRFLVGCLVLCALLGCAGIIMWTPLPGLLMMLWSE